MNIQDRIKDINKLGIFNDEEVKENEYNDCMLAVLKSIEYYQIYHLTNSELYYIGSDTEEVLNTADMIEDTEKGRIYCWS